MQVVSSWLRLQIKRNMQCLRDVIRNLSGGKGPEKPFSPEKTIYKKGDLLCVLSYVLWD